MNADLYENALGFATLYHLGQKRKYSGQDYIVHPVAVAAIVADVTNDQEMIAAALLHDTVEDTDATLEDVRKRFGERVASLVENLTDISQPEHGNRETRKRIDREHTARAHPDAKTIKLADLIHNTDDITVNDPNFAKVYMREKALLLPFLRDGSAELYARCEARIAAWEAKQK